MYPSIKYMLVQQAVNYSAKDLTNDEKETIATCLNLIKFGMGNTLLNFGNKYYEYDGARDIEEKGLTIGRYESAWFVGSQQKQTCEGRTSELH